MADAEAQAKEQLAKSNEAKAKSVEQAYAHGGTPTPTQEENDLAALGVHTDEHADDGSGPSPQFEMVNTAHTKKQSEAKPSGGGNYQTRAASPAKETTKQPQS
jgi:hypothetical protein